MPAHEHSFGEQVSALIALLIALTCWGAMYVPSKQEKPHDVLFFQFYMAIGILVSGFIFQVMGVYIGQLYSFCENAHFSNSSSNYTQTNIILGTQSTSSHPSTKLTEMIFIERYGFLGGCLWAFANAGFLLSLKFTGLGIGFTMYASMNLSGAYLVSRLGFIPGEPGDKNWVQDAVQVLNLLSVVLAGMVGHQVKNNDDDYVVVGQIVVEQIEGSASVVDIACPNIISEEVGSMLVNEDNGNLSPDVEAGERVSLLVEDFLELGPTKLQPRDETSTIWRRIVGSILALAAGAAGFISAVFYMIFNDIVSLMQIS